MIKRQTLLVSSCLLAVFGYSSAVAAKPSGGGGPGGEPSPILSFAADRESYSVGDTALLSWASAGTRFCTASGAWEGKFSTDGVYRTPPLAGPGTYDLTCKARGGGVTASLSLTVINPDPLPAGEPLPEPAPAPEPIAETTPDPAPVAEPVAEPVPDPVAEAQPAPEPAPEPLPEPLPDPEPVAAPQISFSSAEQSVTSNGYTTLRWSSTDADTCTASGAWSGSRGSAGSVEVGPLNASSTFTLSCSGAGGSSVQMLSISVVSAISLNWRKPTENVDGSTLTDLIGYRVYYGSASRDYDNTIEISEPDTTNHTFEASSGEYFVAMTAIDADGNESGFSNEVLKLAP